MNEPNDYYMYIDGNQPEHPEPKEAEEIEAHILHLKQGREIAIKAHESFLREMNEWIRNLEIRLKKVK